MSKILVIKLLSLVCFLLLSANCEGQIYEDDIIDDIEDDNDIFELSNRNYDRESNTYYYLIRIKHQDKKGNLIKLKHAHSPEESGQTVRDFALKTNCKLAFNASTQRIVEGGIRPNGIQIIDGSIIQDINTTAYTLGIKDNNMLLAYHPSVAAIEILEDGTNNALTAFGPLIEDYVAVSDDVLGIRGNYIQKHPRQVIAQLENLDILFLSCGGRGFDGDGMTARDVIRILLKEGVRFAYMLDGGGSTSTVINGELITKKIDANGTRERLRPNFLYVE